MWQTGRATSQRPRRRHTDNPRRSSSSARTQQSGISPFVRPRTHAVQTTGSLSVGCCRFLTGFNDGYQRVHTTGNIPISGSLVGQELAGLTILLHVPPLLHAQIRGYRNLDSPFSPISRADIFFRTSSKDPRGIPILPLTRLCATLTSPACHVCIANI